MTPLAAEILSILPKLRRYSYALIGDQRRGDRYIEIVLETLLEEPARIRLGDDVRFKLYALLHDVIARLGADSGSIPVAEDETGEFDDPARIRRNVLELPLSERKILLLTIVEGFGFTQAAALAQLSLTDASIRATCAVKALSRWLSRETTARAAATYENAALGHYA
jgi:DNA-directed RNA polymerase specialized sigma24 family protein